MELLETIDSVRTEVAKVTSRAKKSALGQFMTPKSVAAFMASLFPAPAGKACRLLDAGAGVGSLTSAFLDRWGKSFDRIEATAFELDEVIREHLAETLASYAARLPIKTHIEGGDFIEHAVNRLQFGRGTGFTHAILNPPYKTRASRRQAARRAGQTLQRIEGWPGVRDSLSEPPDHGKVLARDCLGDRGVGGRPSDAPDPLQRLALPWPVRGDLTRHHARRQARFGGFFFALFVQKASRFPGRGLDLLTSIG